ncbi:hypothetical protein ACGFSG_19525 [Streptomyces sp. NPDC048512]|jgi:hypothetical protein|uniref:hypothetical protein n=1 Tax=Streptomyces sp. NPDC048512 TaxID=3365563 RepID=UPI00372206D1
MSETTGRTGGVAAGQVTEQTGHRSAATAVVHESYSFACMRCGHGWEQSYAIEHHHDGDGAEFVTYVADGRTVPSPLSRPSCLNCDSHVVRIMRAGQVSSVLDSLHSVTKPRPVPRQPAEGAEGAEGAAPGDSSGTPKEPHHWHLSDLLHPFQHRKAG